MEVFLIRFLSLRERDKPQQSVTSEKYRNHCFFDPIVGDTVGTTSSRAQANIVGDS
jgi:hypothetical protein